MAQNANSRSSNGLIHITANLPDDLTAEPGQHPSPKTTEKAPVDISDSIFIDLVGVPYPLIPPGVYEGHFTHHDVSPRFGGKLYMWFQITSCGEFNGVKLFKAYNVQFLGGKRRKRRFTVTARSKFVLDYQRLFGRLRRRDRPSPHRFKEKIFSVSVKTVTHDSKQRELHTNNQYSVIEEIIQIVVGK